MSETRKVVWTEDWELSEIYDGGFQMALCSPPDDKDEYKKATCFVTCKDFFQDATQAAHIGSKRAIYDFKYDPKKDPALSLDRFRVLVANNLDKKFESRVENAIDFLNQFEKKIHLIRSTAYKCDPTPEKWKDSGGVYMFEGSGRWMQAPPMISLYTLLLRCGFVHTKGDDFEKTCKAIMEEKLSLGDKGKRESGCYDDNYLRDGQPGIKAILEHGYARLFYKDAARNFPKEIGVNAMHDRCGIVGWSQKKVKAEMPYWYRLLDVAKKRPAKKKAVPVEAPILDGPAAVDAPVILKKPAKKLGALKKDAGVKGPGKKAAA